MLSTILDLLKTGMSFLLKKEKNEKTKDELDVEKSEDTNETNREEVKAGKGWRNFLGYACTVILIYNYILVPILDYFGIVLFSFPLSDIIRIIILLVSGN
ncbi:hypothetical protein PVD82_003311 [Enterobacter hormaechei]|nr:hypothetical protein [Enterobacter hormaechei]EKM7549954.1 hypothetical protein [Enterobacter hormaechei]EKV5294893.1 hypothetical protein [Enterobacter hormaechei]EKW8461160.1 hypothetical protein [Enterobacter hormaechei]